MWRPSSGTWFVIPSKTPSSFLVQQWGVSTDIVVRGDYDGDGKRPINFKMHGTLDAVQAATAALGPVLHGFAGEPEAAFFYGQAASEVAVIASTDWDAGMPFSEQRLAA